MNREKNNYNHEEIQISEWGAHTNESQYVKYCGMEETTKLLKLRLNMIKFDSNCGQKGTCKICQKVAETMEHMLECKEAKK